MSTEALYDLPIQVQIETKLTLPESQLRAAVTWVLHTHDVRPHTGMSIVITDDEEVRRLNRQFRAVDVATDVLSFPAAPDGMPEEEPYLGDLVLALPHIRRQAKAEKHSLSDELILVVIHGTLHLLGYDHDTIERQNSMWTVQDQALGAMGVHIVVPRFEFPDASEMEFSNAGDESA